jgi:hypothetical protein
MDTKKVCAVPFLAAGLMLGCTAPETEAPTATPEPAPPAPEVGVYGLAAPILAGQEEAFQEVVAEITGERAEVHRTAYGELGATKEQVWLQKTPEGSMAVVVLEGTDLEGLGEREAASEDPHVQWFLGRLGEIHGFDPASPPPPNQLVFHGDVSGVEGETHPFAIAVPILEGKRATFDEFIAAFEEKKAAWEESRRAKGVAKEYVWLQETPAGAMVVVYFESTSPDGPPLTDETELEFDAWFQESIADIHGIQPGDSLPPNEKVK